MNKVFLIWPDYDVTLLPKTQMTDGMQQHQQSLMDFRGVTHRPATCNKPVNFTC